MPRIEQSRLFYYYFFFISVLMELLIFALTRKSPHHRILDVIVFLICFSILKNNNNNNKIHRMLFYSPCVAAKRTKQRKREKNLKETPRCTILSCDRAICFSFCQSFQVSANVHLVGLYMAVW